MGNKFNQCLIVSDMDGTFFGEGAEVLQSNLDAINYFKSNGGIFSFATGRDFKVLETYFSSVISCTSGPSILCNGAYLYDFQSKTFSDELTLDKIEFFEALSIIQKKYHDIGFRISCHFGFLCQNISPFLEKSLSRYSDIVVKGDLKDYIQIPWHKCVFCAEPEIVENLSEFFFDGQFSNITTVASAQTLFEIIPSRAGKGGKLQALKRMFPGRQTICVGDYSNDFDMLLAADISACPENAIDAIKDISKIHLCHHREGCIADLIYKLDSSIKE